MNPNILLDSFFRHVQLIEILVEYKDFDGITRIDGKLLESKINRNFIWVKKAIKRLNLVDECIEYIGYNRQIKKYCFKVNYTNIAQKGFFNLAFRFIKDMISQEISPPFKIQDLCERYQCERSAIRPILAYWGMDMKFINEKYQCPFDYKDIEKAINFSERID